MLPTNDLNIIDTTRLASPRALKSSFPASEAANRTVIEGRQVVQQILRHEDARLLVVVGPCSIHDEQGALEYAENLVRLRRDLQDRLFLVMRVYFEKPRTTVGWKGLISDPHLDGSSDIDHGLRKARRLLLAITEMGLPAATEFLDPIVPQYIDDLVSWAAIGARTTESQTHREMASGLSMPVGFKNSTDGSLQVALDALVSARSGHSFLGIDQDGLTSIVRTRGNPYGHVVLRGGRTRTNFDATSVADAVAALEKAGQHPRLMVDCSHANSNKKHKQQVTVAQNVAAQRAAGVEGIIGLMIESYLHEGNQEPSSDRSTLKYGVSITDACIGWDTTERLLREIDEKLNS